MYMNIYEEENMKTYKYKYEENKVQMGKYPLPRHNVPPQPA